MTLNEFIKFFKITDAIISIVYYKKDLPINQALFKSNKKLNKGLFFILKKIYYFLQNIVTMKCKLQIAVMIFFFVLLFFVIKFIIY